MKQFLRIMPLLSFSCRFESKTVVSERVRNALKRYNHENKTQFGKLLKTAPPKSKVQVEGSENVVPNSSDSVSSHASTVQEPGKVNLDLNDDVISHNLRFRKTKSKSNSIVKDPQVSKLDDKTVKKKMKSSKQKLDESIGEYSLKDISSPKIEKASRKTKAVKESFFPTVSDESVKPKEELEVINIVTHIEETVDNIRTENVCVNNVQVDAYVEKSTQSSDVRLSETNENLSNTGNTNNLEDENEIFNANPLSAFPLLNDSKMFYSPDLTYTEMTSVHPNYYPYPSVSHILSESMTAGSETNLKRWKENLVSELGNEKFEVYSKSLMHSAKSLRKLILLRLRGIPDAKLDIIPELMGCWESLKFIFPLFPKVKEIGKITVHRELKYKGMVDSLIEFRNKLVLVNWKKANKYVPSLDKTYDFPIQCVAYMGAINSDPNFPYLVDEALLVMSYTNGMKADVFHLKTDQCERYWKLWLERLHTYRCIVKETDVRDSKSDLGKLNVEEELARMKKEKVSLKKSESDCVAFVNQSETKENINLTLVANSNFPLFNEEKSIYTRGQNFEFKAVDQTAFSSYPAVTTILSETKSTTSKFILERWKNNMIAELGVEGFETYQKNLLSSGVAFHKLIQNHLEGAYQDIPKELMGCWDSLQPVFPLIDEVKFTENKVVHEKLQYKGIIDCIAEFRNKLVVIDWKKSDKLKSTINMTYDAPLQIAAYIGALNFDRTCPFKVEEGLLVISYVDGSKADVYNLNAENCQKYWEQWLQRLRKYQIEVNANSER